MTGDTEISDLTVGSRLTFSGTQLETTVPMDTDCPTGNIGSWVENDEIVPGPLVSLGNIVL